MSSLGNFQIKRWTHFHDSQFSDCRERVCCSQAQPDCALVCQPFLASPSFSAVVVPHLERHGRRPAELRGCRLLPARAQVPAGALEGPAERRGARGHQPVAETTYHVVPAGHEPVLPPPVCEGEGLPRAVSRSFPAPGLRVLTPLEQRQRSHGCPLLPLLSPGALQHSGLEDGLFLVG